MYTRLYSLVFAVIFAFSATSSFAAGIDWAPFSNAVFAKAKQQHKLILVFGKAEWCPWCRKMRENTYADRTVISLINQHYIPVRVDIDNDTNAASAYDIQVVPKTIILDANGRTVDSQTGYIDSSEMTRFLQNNVK